jgi:hypothetical protein
MTGEAARLPLGSGLLAATIASCLIGLVPAFSSSGSTFSNWLIAAGSVALLVGPAALGLGSRGSWRKPAFWIGCGLALPLVPLMLLGGLLKTATHHRPLGAATFAFIACAVVAGSVVFCWRAQTLTDRLSGPRGGLIRSVVGGAALLSGGWVLLRLVQLASSSNFVLALAELALSLLALWVASHPKTQQRLANVPSLVGIAAWLSMVLAAALVAMSLDPQLAGTPSTAVLWLLLAP